MSYEHSQIVDVFYLVCMGNTLLYRRDVKLAICDYGLELEPEQVIGSTPELCG